MQLKFSVIRPGLQFISGDIKDNQFAVFAKSNHQPFFVFVYCLECIRMDCYFFNYNENNVSSKINSNSRNNFSRQIKKVLVWQT